MRARLFRRAAALLAAALACCLGFFAGHALADSYPFSLPMLDDLPAVDVTSWELMLANSYNSVGYEYVMPQYGSFEGQGIEPRIMEDVKAMVAAARADGVSFYISVGYRNGDFCLTNYTALVPKYGSAVETCKHFMPPGCNEHQTGLAIDVTDREAYSANYNPVFDDSSVYGTDTYDWMMAHCTEYGFVFRYPEGKEAWYGDRCPHFHFRYVGRELASYLTEHDLCLEEFLYLEDPDCLYVPGLN